MHLHPWDGACGVFARVGLRHKLTPQRLWGFNDYAGTTSWLRWQVAMHKAPAQHSVAVDAPPLQDSTATAVFCWVGKPARCQVCSPPRYHSTWPWPAAAARRAALKAHQVLGPSP